MSEKTEKRRSKLYLKNKQIIKKKKKNAAKAHCSKALSMK